jgi:hypothetical protein
MELIEGFFIGVALETLILFVYALCSISSKCSRLEEEQNNRENV